MNDPRSNGIYGFEETNPLDSKLTKEASSDLVSRLSEQEMLRYFPTRDDKMYEVLKIVRKAAPTKVPILISGETGTGKEVLAKAVHIAGAAEGGRFVVASCSGLPENFFEIDIFSGNNQAIDYSSYQNTHVSCSLLLDEISDLNQNMQLKLLQVLKNQENGTFNNSGTVENARVISTSSRDLNDYVQAKKFKGDLLYKLCIIFVNIPPLRKRPVDIDFYSDLFLKEFNSQFSKDVQLSLTAKQALRTYTWPGNVKELRNVIQRAVLLSTGNQVDVDSLHLVKSNSRTELALSETLPQVTLRELEQRLILQTLRRMSGNRTHTAKALGISLRALRYKLNELVDCGYEVEGKNA